MFRNLINLLEGIESLGNNTLVGYIDEYNEGDVWLIKCPPQLVQHFLLLANSIEDQAVKGTAYDPDTGMMTAMHKQMGVTAGTPQWAVVKGVVPGIVQEDLKEIKPITQNIVKTLRNARGDMQEFMSEFLWKLENAGYALTTEAEAEYVGNDIQFAKDNLN